MAVVSKNDFIDKFKEKTGVETKKMATECVEAFITIIQESLQAGDSVQFVGWGSFEIKHNKAKEGRNPKTGEKINIPESKGVKFKAGKKFINSVK